MAKESRNSTYMRIIDAALVLFNEEGEQQVSTNRIAAYLGISPGNLYYHFRNKDEIIMQLFKRYSGEFLDGLRHMPIPDDAGSMREYMTAVYDVMWRYRFLFGDVNTMLVRSAQLLGEHNEFTRDKISPLLLALLRRMTENGLIVTDITDRQDLVPNIWLVTKYWFSFDSSLYGRQPGENSRFRGVYRTLSLLRPYIAPAHKEAFSRMMEALPSGKDV